MWCRWVCVPLEECADFALGARRKSNLRAQLVAADRGNGGCRALTFRTPGGRCDDRAGVGARKSASLHYGRIGALSPLESRDSALKHTREEAVAQAVVLVTDNAVKIWAGERRVGVIPAGP
jgi:hypothetical protein